MGVGAGLYMYVVVVQKFTFAISSPDELLFFIPYDVAQQHYFTNIITRLKLLWYINFHCDLGLSTFVLKITRQVTFAMKYAN